MTAESFERRYTGMTFQSLEVKYGIEETDERVAVAPLVVTRFRRKAERRALKANARRMIPSYRWVVVRRADGRYEVVAMQNRARPL